MRTTSKISVRVGRCTTREVGKSRERHDKSRVENLDNRTVFLGQNVVSGRVYGLATAYVDDFVIVVDAQSAGGLSALAGVRELYD